MDFTAFMDFLLLYFTFKTKINQAAGVTFLDYLTGIQESEDYPLRRTILAFCVLFIIF